MNTKFNGADNCTPKKLAAQLMVEAAKILNNQQRQALVDIFKTLDQAEKSAHQLTLPLLEADPRPKNHSQNFVYQDELDQQDEFNQEFWSGHHCDSYSQEYPEDWLNRTKQRPRKNFSNSSY